MSNTGDRLSAIWNIIDNEWAGMDISPDFSGLMRAALSKDKQDGAISGPRPEMALLLGLCCQAAGGEASWADTVTAAWMLFYAAADIMDSVEDQDVPASWWKDLGPATALSVATGLFFSAASILYKIENRGVARDIVPVVIQDFLNSFMVMSNGQYDDLRNRQPTIEQYWKVASAKSGAFFALACRSGARLAIGDHFRSELYGKFGNHIGLLIQILDDLGDISFQTQSVGSTTLGKLMRSLPVVYTMQMVPDEVKERFQVCLQDAIRDPRAAEEAVSIMDKNGAVIYLLSEIERNKNFAMDFLARAGAISPAREILTSYVEKLGVLP